jgi:hypothetical protein
MFEHILQMMNKLDTGQPNMPPTLLYNEGWLLRIILDWYSKSQSDKNLINFFPGAKWYSEGLLSSIFLPNRRGDRVGEAYTRADGVLGHFSVGNAGKGDIILANPYRQFVVIEAKLFSKIASGTKNAPGYNQVARNIACMANVIYSATNSNNAEITGLKDLGFYLLAPDAQLKEDISFIKYTEKSFIKQVVEKRLAFDSKTHKITFSKSKNPYFMRLCGFAM